jgi:hypothetical protein
MDRNRRSDRTESSSMVRTAGDQPARRAPEAAGQECKAEVPGDLADELLMDGQEEVFSRTEVESGRFEHHVGEERAVPVSPSRPTTAG